MNTIPKQDQSLRPLSTDVKEEQRRRPLGIDVKALMAKYGIYLFVIGLLALSGIASPVFLQADNVKNMLVQWAPLGIVVIGQAMVMLVRGLDLSVASVMATAAVLSTGFGTDNKLVVPIVASSLLIGACTGLVNGLLVTKRNVSPFLATFATAAVLLGVRYAYTQGAPSGNIPPWFQVISTQSVYGIPFAVIILTVLACVLGVLLHKSTFGRKVYIVGGNPESARLVGINADRVTIACYVLCSLLAAVAGLLLAGYAGIVDNFVGRGFELDSVVAAVMGGVALTGGRGSIFGALVGAAILVVVFNIVLLMGFPIQAQIIIKGLVVIVAAAFYVDHKH
jgi:ribose/xylose/arabinose/galactoside ABC-type transport system permease subunit